MLFRDRFIGSSLGIVWAVVSPILMLGIFTFVFGFVFRSKLPGAETSLSYVIWLISGYGPWLSITESILSAAGSIIGGAQLIKNIKMKSELLAIASVAMGVVPLIVSLVYLTVLMFAEGRPIYFLACSSFNNSGSIYFCCGYWIFNFFISSFYKGYYTCLT